VIASVSGKVLIRQPDYVVVEAAGVGYRLVVSAETLKAVPARGEDATLHAHLIPRDDALNLYGFSTESERDLFLELISVSGVGPKVAIAALSGGTPSELLRAIASGDVKRFTAVPGIGKRTAERVIVELRDRVAGELEQGLAAVGEDGEDARTLAREGLVGLGYGLVEAERLLAGSEGESAEELIGAALRRAGSGGETREAA
jgi:Holliday junction DNA helicase RuvA